MTEGKVLTKVSAFFDIPMWLIIIAIDGTLYSEISGTVCSEIVACFKMKNEHKDLHRNKANNIVLLPAKHQQLKGVGSKCTNWW